MHAEAEGCTRPYFFYSHVLIQLRISLKPGNKKKFLEIPILADENTFLMSYVRAYKRICTSRNIYLNFGEDFWPSICLLVSFSPRFKEHNFPP